MFNTFSTRIMRACLIAAGLLFVTSANAAPRRKAVPAAKTFTVQQLVRRVMPSIVRLTVLGKDGTPAVQGSGFVVGYDLIATNFHVVQDAHSVTANFENGRSEAIFGIVGYDSAHDLVLLRAFTKGVAALSLESKMSVQVGDPIVAFGSPEGLGGSISTGIISGIRQMGGGKVIQTTAAISHGSSGGALVDMRGHVVGVTSFFYTEGQNLNFAYPASYVRKMIDHPFKHLITWRDIEDYAKKPATATKDTSVPSKPTSRAADTALYTEKPLAGLKEISVVVEDINPDAKADGLDAVTIKADTETKLRAYGINVVPKASNDPKNPGAMLNIEVSTFYNTDAQLYSYSIAVCTFEYATLTRALPVKAIVRTWSRVGYGTVGKAKVSTLADTVKTYVGQFVYDYSAQNPK